MATITYFIRTTRNKKEPNTNGNTNGNGKDKVVRKKNDSVVNIRVKLRHNQTFLYAKTPYSIEIENWDSKKQRIKQGRAHAVRDTINNSLTSLETYLSDLWKTQVNKTFLTSDWLQNKVNNYLKDSVRETKEITLKRFVNEFADNLENEVSEKTGKKYKYRTIQKHSTTRDRLIEFIDLKYPGILLTEIDHDFYRAFLAYLTNEMDYSVNTVGKYIGSLKTMLNATKKKGVFINTDGFKKISEVSDSIYLNEEEIGKIYNLDLSNNERLDRVRDLFVVGCWTALRFGDLTDLDKDYLMGKRIIREQDKTGNKVHLPHHWMTKAIIQKYDYQLPLDISNQKFNDYIKEVCEQAGIDEIVVKGITKGGKRVNDKFKKFDLVSTHTARRSFATNLYNSDFPAISIMALTGHKSVDSFLAYIKVTPEEHAQKLEKHWEELNTKKLIKNNLKPNM